MSRQRIITAATAIFGMAIFFLSFVVPVKREMGWTDAVTRSEKRQTYITFSFGLPPLLKTSPVIEPSPLATWLARQDGEVEYHWCHTNGTLKTIWGTSVGCGHGRAPPIHLLPAGMLECFVASSTDDELRRFVDVMRHGNEQEQEAAVQAVAKRILNSGHR
jgi:hypothetical protein